MHGGLLRNVGLMDGGELRLLGHEAGQGVVHRKCLSWSCRKGRRGESRGWYRGRSRNNGRDRRRLFDKRRGRYGNRGWQIRDR